MNTLSKILNYQDFHKYGIAWYGEAIRVNININNYINQLN